MKTLLTTLVCTIALCATSLAADRPSIVVILADDLGWADVGFQGDEIKTPNIDRLAQGGVKLNQFYVQPTCSPTRIALMSGRYPFRCGGHISVLRPYHLHGLPLEERLLSEAMKAAGYKTAITGKWHLGLARRAYWPQSRGFDLAYGHLGGAINYFTHKHEAYNLLDWYDQDTIPLKEEGYSTDLIGDRASRIIGEHDFSKQPLFLYVPFNAPHGPLMAKPEDIKRYSHIKDEKRRTYCAMVACMDEQVGNIVQALKDKGVLDDTLIFFASDNGGPTNSGADNGPFRGGKGSPYEGGVRVPALIHWTAKLDGGRVYESPLHIVDLYPTLTALAGGSTEKCLPLDGIDVWSAIAGEASLPKRDILLNVKDARGRGSIRSGDWKLIVSKPGQAPEGLPLEGVELMAELFDIRKDPYEKNNLATEHPDVVEMLWAKLKKHGPDVGAAKPYNARAPEGWVAPSDWSKVPE